MREIGDINTHALRTLDTAHLIHGEVMNEIVEVEELLRGNIDNNRRIYYNSRLSTLISVYGLLNDIMWEKEKNSRKGI